MEISLESAQKIVLNSHLLYSNDDIFSGKEGVFNIIDRLGYVQIDTISVIERAHHHVLWTRCRDYEENMLYDLHEKDRKIFEYWGHARSYLPMKDYRFSLPKMRNFENMENKWVRFMIEKSEGITDTVLERIRKEGPLSLKDFDSNASTTTSAFGKINPPKAALELLFLKGDIMVSGRQKFQKVFDLTERVLPDDTNTIFPDKAEISDFHVRRALSALGIAGEKEIGLFMQPPSSRDSHFSSSDKKVIKNTINKLSESGDVVKLRIENSSGDKSFDEIYYILSGILEKSVQIESDSNRVFFLSPFDNLINQRKRFKQLFEFDYSLECYTPAAKRKYGYFVLPVLWGNSFIGRFDPKTDRKNKTLIINSLLFEDDFKNYDSFLPLFAAKLKDFASFNKCDKITLGNINPGKIKQNLEILISRAGM